MNYADDLRKTQIEHHKYEKKMQTECGYEALFLDGMVTEIQNKAKYAASKGKSSISGGISRDSDRDFSICEGSEEYIEERGFCSKNLCNGKWVCPPYKEIKEPDGYLENDQFIVDYLTKKLNNLGFKICCVKLLYPKVKFNTYKKNPFYFLFGGEKGKWVTHYEENDGRKTIYFHISW